MLAVLGVVATLLSPRGGHARPPTTEGSLVLLSQTEGAEVFIEGKLVGKVPLSGPISLKPGKYTLKMTKRGYTEYIDVFTIRPRKRTRLDIDLLPVAGVVRVTANVTGARLFVDGKYTGDTPLEVDVPPGLHTLKLAKGGFREAEKKIEVIAGKEMNLDLVLEELPPEQNPFKSPPPRPPRWYERWWVWAVVAGGATAVALAIALPSYYLSRDPIDAFGPQFCWGVGVPCR